jgi:hypothetical protein
MTSGATFPIFRVAQWQGDVSNGMTTWSGRDLYDKRTRELIAQGPEVMSSCTVRHASDEFIVVLSSRREDHDESRHRRASYATPKPSVKRLNLSDAGSP